MCYSGEGRRPPAGEQDGSTEYVVLSRYLNMSRETLRNISVIAYGVFCLSTENNL